MDHPDCYSCRVNAATDPPPRESIVRTPHWRVVHAFNSSLPGWLVLVPHQHVFALADLPDEAYVELGLLQGRLSRALATVTGCVKTYSMLFAEAPGFSHLHVHLVPRMPDQPPDRLGPAVFGHLVDDEAAWLPAAEMDRIAEEIAATVDLSAFPLA